MAPTAPTTAGHDPTHPGPHPALPILKFVANMLFAAVAGGLLALAVSSVLYHILPSNMAIWLEDFSTLLPAACLGYLAVQKLQQESARWIWIAAIVLWLLFVIPDVGRYRGALCSLSRGQYLLREYLFNFGPVCGEGLGWFLYTLPTLCCIGYSVGAELAMKKPSRHST